MNGSNQVRSLRMLIVIIIDEAMKAYDQKFTKDTKGNPVLIVDDDFKDLMERFRAEHQARFPELFRSTYDVNPVNDTIYEAFNATMPKITGKAKSELFEPINDFFKVIYNELKGKTVH